MGFKKTYLSAALPALAFLAGACSGSSKGVDDPFVDFPDDGKLANVVSVVTSPSTTDTVFSFDGHKVDFDETIRRSRMYFEQETAAREKHACRMEGMKNA